MTDVHTTNKQALEELRAAMVNFDKEAVRKALCSTLKDDAEIHIAHPFGDLQGPEEFYHCLLYTSPSPRDLSTSRMPSSA